LIVLSFKQRLYALVGVSALALVLFATVAIYGIRDGLSSLSDVYERQVEPAAALHQMEEALKDVRFRLAAYLLDQMPAVGNVNHLQEARTKAIDNWRRFQEATANNPFEDGDRELIARIEKNIGNIDSVFRQLAQGYRNDDKSALTAVLEDEWPFAIHAALLKPIAQLLLVQQAAVGTVYETRVARSEHQVSLGVVILTVATLLLAAFAARLAAGLTRRLDDASGVADRVAAGDWSGTIDTSARDEVGQLLRAIGHMRDEVHARELRLETILHNTAEGIITFDQRGMIEGFNQAAKRLFGWEEKEVVGTSVGLLIVADAQDRREGYLEHFLRNEIKQLIGHEGEMTGRHKDGTVFPLALKVSTMSLEGKELYVALVADISERKAMMERLKAMAERDGLTGLYNRRYFQGELERVVERVRRAGESSCALLYIDLDNFKYVNDTLGHAAGDQLLVQVTGILRKRARKGDLVARFGGDEFTVLVYDTMPDKVALIADSFRQLIAGLTFHYEGQHVDIGCSIGVTTLGAQTRDAAEALSQADLACHLAKRGGRNRVYVFTEADAGNVATMSLDMGWSRRIKDAVEKGKFLPASRSCIPSRVESPATRYWCACGMTMTGSSCRPGACPRPSASGCPWISIAG
jgi:diguanylate cyclase (GGDEF)-like protein/PAS domain S-box-containing protein